MLTRGERSALAIAVGIVFCAIAGAHMASDRATRTLLDNVHWCASFLVAAWLAWLGARRAPELELRPRQLFAVALLIYALGQLVYTAQVVTGWQPFPAPSDALFIPAGPIATAGLFLLLHRRTRASQRNLLVLDVAGLSIALLALTVALYLPKRGDVTATELAVLVAYPVVMFLPACVGVIGGLTLQLAPRLGWLLFVGAWFVNGGLWLQWNALTLDGATEDGTVFNALFSIASLMQGIGALCWQTEESSSERWRRACGVILRVLPLVLVCVAALTVVWVHNLPNVPPVVQWVANLGGATVVVVASLRQSVTIGEHERLIRAERALREAEDLYRVLFDHAAEGIFISDASGRYVDVNPRGAQMLQRTREEIVSLSIRDIVSPEERTRVEGEVARAMAGTSLNRPWKLMRKDQTTFPAEVNATILPDGRLLGTVRDISERVELEGQLRQAQKMEAVGTLAAGIAHDFNNLIAAIAGNAELATLAADSRERTAHSLKEIRAASARAAELVRQIVAFSRPDAPSARVIDIAREVEEVGGLLRSTLPAGIELSVAAAPALPGVRVDATQLHQVLVNLGTNAWQAMEGNSGSIRIAIDPEQIAAENSVGLDGGRYVRIEVEDTGTGMDAKIRDRIFEPFFTTKGVGQGTGLGLAIVHRIVQAHRGAITVESNPGQGTRFRIWLPAVESAAAAELPPAQAPAPSGTSARAVRICYVDDENLMVSVIRRHLERRGYRFVGFSSSEAALTALAAAPFDFDVLVTDFNMPKLSGIDLMAKLHPLRPDAPFILTSGSIDSDLAARAAAVGARRLLHKPYSLGELEEAIQHVANAVYGAVPAAPSAPDSEVAKRSLATE